MVAQEEKVEPLSATYIAHDLLHLLKCIKEQTILFMTWIYI